MCVWQHPTTPHVPSCWCFTFFCTLALLLQSVLGFMEKPLLANLCHHVVYCLLYGNSKQGLCMQGHTCILIYHSVLKTISTGRLWDQLGQSSNRPQTVISPFNFFFHSPLHDSQVKRRRIGLPLLEIDERDTLIIMENSMKPNFSSFPLG